MVETDETLLARSAGGDREAYGLLVARYHAALCAFAAARLPDRSLAEDVVQETFLRVWRSLGRIPEEQGFHAWLFGTARNVARELARAERRDRKMKGTVVAGETGEVREMMGERRERLLTAMAALPEGMQMVLALKYTEGLSCEEIGRRLGRPVGTVTSLLARAYHEIRKTVGKEPA